MTVRVYQNLTKEEALEMLLHIEEPKFKFEMGDYITDSRLEGSGSVYQVVHLTTGWTNRYTLMNMYNRSETLEAYEVDKHFRKATAEELKFYEVEL